MYRKILSNKVKCLKCGEVLESTYRHDFRTCECGNVSVDGGLDYIRRGYIDKFAYLELSECLDENGEKMTWKKYQMRAK